ncbi:MAG: alcohol dehydrogenase catalytic domain-containing protein [Thermoplasmatota archaeon]
MPDTMRAVVFHEHGDSKVLRLEEVAKPAPGPGEALVRVRYAALNHLDVHTRRGIPGNVLALPHVGGCDGAGEVAELGAGASGVHVGEAVTIDPSLTCGVCEFCRAGHRTLCVKLRLLGEHLPGTFAEYVRVPVANLIPTPAGFDLAVAAAAPLVYMTAWHMLARARLAAGEDVLVMGASGGVAAAAIQIARHLGARVFAATSSDEKAKRAIAEGAEFAVDTSREDVRKRVRELTAKRGVDVVVDHVGGDAYVAGVTSLRRGGRYVTCGATAGNGPPAQLHYIFWNQLDVLGSTMAEASEAREVMRLVFAGTLKPAIDRVLPLDACAEGQRLLENRQHFGKIVLRID